MSDGTVRLGFTIVGGVVGAYFGNPQLGMMVGGAIGNAVAGPEQQTVEGPKPSSTGITGSSHGTPIPIVLGTHVVSGQVFDGEDEIEVVKNEESGGGKGGGGKGASQITYDTFATSAILLAEVPEKGKRYKLRRLWWNAKLVYDRRPGIGEFVDIPDFEGSGFDEDLDAIPNLFIISGFVGPAKGGVFSSAGEGVPNSSFTPTGPTDSLLWESAGGAIETISFTYNIEPDTVMLADNAVNYIYVDQDDDLGNSGEIKSSTEGFGSDIDIPLWIVTTKDGEQTERRDVRSFVHLQSFFQRHAQSDLLDGFGRFYDGGPDQQPDPTLEAIHGEGNVPAYRGFCYLMLDRLPVTDQGGRIGNWEAELVLEGDEADVQEELLRTKVLYPWVPGEDPRNLFNVHTYRAGANGVPSGAESHDSLGAAKGSSINGVLYGWTAANNVPLGEIPKATHPGELNKIYLRFGAFRDPEFFLPTRVEDYDWHNLPEGTLFWSADNSAGTLFATRTGLNFVTRYNVSSGEIAGALPPGGISYWNIDSVHSVPGQDVRPALLKRADTVVEVIRVPQYPPQGCGGHPWEQVSGNSQWCVNVDTGEYKPNLLWTIEEDDGGFYAGSEYAIDTGTEGLEDGREIVASYPEGPVVRATDPRAGTSYAPEQIDEAQKALLDLEAVPANPIALAEALRLISKLCGVPESRLDTSQVDKNLWGLVLNGGTARQYIEALRLWGLFDPIESEGLVKFQPRGQAPALTVDPDDLGVDGGSRLSSRRTEDFELPRRVRVHYASLGAGYEAGLQVSRRQITRSENDADVRMLVADIDGHAAEIAQIVLNEFWRARNEREHTLLRQYDRLEPSDVVTLPLDGVNYRLRIAEKTYADSISLRCVDDDAAEYSAEALGAGVKGGGEIAGPVGPTRLLVLDLPALQDSHGGAGYYLAVWGVLPAWHGGVVQLSEDGGTTWQNSVALDTAATVGAIVDPPGVGPSTIVDRANSIEVEMRSGDLFSTDEINLLNGTANTVAIGADGRWLIVSFRDVEQLENGNLRLTRLVQGRKGTEQHIGTVIEGDHLVLLNSNIGRIQTQNVTIGQDLHLRAGSIGEGSPVSSQEFVYTGVNLMPLSPVHIRGRRNEDGDLAIDWTRRTRLGGGWQFYPLYEEQEQYELEFRHPDTTTVMRTVTVIPAELSKPGHTYTAAEQAADFGAAQDPVLVRIYQISAIVGRGFVGEAML